LPLGDEDEDDDDGDIFRRPTGLFSAPSQRSKLFDADNEVRNSSVISSFTMSFSFTQKLLTVLQLAVCVRAVSAPNNSYLEVLSSIFHRCNKYDYKTLYFLGVTYGIP